ncbi:MAG: hypothetical protein HYS78_01050 [Parcubacteria group bacterium]|nr:hypothetical protein [Parcubacteria group bacterium]
MNLRKFSVFSVVFIVSYLLLFTFTFAQGDDFLGVEDFTVQRIAAIITGFACWLLGIVLAIMVIALIISGIMFFKATSFVTDGGKTTEINTAKKNFQWVLVGILVILATNVIIATVANALGSSYSFIPLNCGQTSSGQ